MAQIAPSSVRPLSRLEYNRLVELGSFEDEHVELLHGMLITMSPQSAARAECIGRLTETLVLAVAGSAIVRIQSPLAIQDHSEPEPDVAVVPLGNYATSHPQGAWLIVEVAETSLRKDSTVKAALYAQANVTEYWIVNLSQGAVDIYSEPRDGVYTSIKHAHAGDIVRLIHFPDVCIDIASILP